jgi:hypothetical protein
MSHDLKHLRNPVHVFVIKKKIIWYTVQTLNTVHSEVFSGNFIVFQKHRIKTKQNYHNSLMNSFHRIIKISNYIHI